MEREKLVNMSESKAMNHDEVRNSFKNHGPLGPPNITTITDTGGNGLLCIRGKEHQITSLVNNRGASLTMVTPSVGDLGDGKTPPKGERGTRNVAGGTADADMPTVTRLGNPDGSGLIIVSGGGSNPTLSISLGDKSCSFTMSAKGSDGQPVVHIVAGEQEWSLDHKGFKVTAMPIQERKKNKPDIDGFLDNQAKQMQSALQPYTNNSAQSGWGCCGGSSNSGSGSSSEPSVASTVNLPNIDRG